MKELYTKLRCIYVLAEEILELAPRCDTLNQKWEDVLAEIKNVTEIIDDVRDKDGFIPELHEAEIIFEAYGNEEDCMDMLTNLETQYPEFMRDCEKDEHKTSDEIYQRFHFYGIWIGEVETLVKLTHHAEGMYEGTGFNNVHVEVYVDGTWHK